MAVPDAVVATVAVSGVGGVDAAGGADAAGGFVWQVAWPLL